MPFGSKNGWQTEISSCVFCGRVGINPSAAIRFNQEKIRPRHLLPVAETPGLGGLSWSPARRHYTLRLAIKNGGPTAKAPRFPATMLVR